MSNSIQCFLTVSNLNSEISDFLKKIESNYAYYFKRVDDLNIEYITDYLNFKEILGLSAQVESKITITYYDTSVGYLRRKLFNRGYLVSDNSAPFSIDIESDIYDISKANNTDFAEELNNYLDKYGEENSNFPQVGDYIRINESICEDVDVLDWLEEQKYNQFKITNIELETNGIWVEGCEYRLEIQECILLSKPTILEK